MYVCGWTIVWLVGVSTAIHYQFQNFPLEMTLNERIQASKVNSERMELHSNAVVLVMQTITWIHSSFCVSWVSMEPLLLLPFDQNATTGAASIPRQSKINYIKEIMKLQTRPYWCMFIYIARMGISINIHDKTHTHIIKIPLNTTQHITTATAQCAQIKPKHKP